ncbi:MAG TPA: hypothetical protein VK881_09815 [bacterium]|nr:hypothetical protein [bacterium]
MGTIDLWYAHTLLAREVLEVDALVLILLVLFILAATGHLFVH